MTTIPASSLVNVQPNVLAASGSALASIGLLLTNSTQLPIGVVQPFGSLLDVQNYFGGGSTEAIAAAIYFAGFTNANVLPASVLFAQFNTAAVSGYLRGGSISAMTLTQVKALTGTLTITVGGVGNTSASIDLSGAASFSACATTIQAAFTTPAFAVTYDATAAAFKFTSTATGAAATVAFATGSGTILAGLNLTAATGAVLSQGADIAVPGTFMTALIAQTRNWASFATLFNPDSSGNANKLLFATWAGQQNNEFMYSCWDTDTTPTTTVPATASLGYLLDASSISGTVLVYSADYTLAVFQCAWAASVDKTQTNGRTTLAFRQQSGLVPSVTNKTVADNLIANHYNFYGIYATANQNFTGMYPGSISGAFRWADSFLNQIILNNDLQLSLMTLLFNEKSIPYNTSGYTLIDAACRDPILAGVNFGSIRVGVQPSALQAQEMNNAAGRKIDDIMFTQGWYLQVTPASASVRAARQSPPCTLWYMDGQSVQKINLASIEVQ